MWIELRDIHKHYGSVRANDGITLTAAPGSIHGILGENGAGKSTLMKILAGFIPKTSGDILLDHVPVSYQTPVQAAGFGIGMLYQDPLDFLSLSVLDNFMLGQTTGVSNARRSYKKSLARLIHDFGFFLNPDDLMHYLTIGERQQLELLRLISLRVDVMILDEPTTGISSIQKERLFQALKKLADIGKTVILVSHKLEDVEALCDHVTVLRQGTVTGESKKPFETGTLLEMMFGILAPPSVHQDIIPDITLGSPVLKLEKVSAPGGRTGIRKCNVCIHRGEIVGLAGLEGSGQGIFLRVAAGLKRPTTGVVRIGGEAIHKKGYGAAQKKGVSFLPTARIEEGLISGLTIAEHAILDEKNDGLFVDTKKAAQRAADKIRAFQVKGTPLSPVESLSGGNQQRLLLSFLPENPTLLLLENPTRGLDMASFHWVWRYLLRCSSEHTAIVFSSSELNEIMMAADRALVFFNGAIIKDVRIRETDLRALSFAVAGKV